jgi:trigger factor
MAKTSEAAGANPVHMDDVLIEIAGKNTVPEFSQNLTGASAGEERTFDVSYPEDSPTSGWRARLLSIR